MHKKTFALIEKTKNSTLFLGHLEGSKFLWPVKVRLYLHETRKECQAGFLCPLSMDSNKVGGQLSCSWSPVLVCFMTPVVGWQAGKDLCVPISHLLSAPYFVLNRLALPKHHWQMYTRMAFSSPNRPNGRCRFWDRRKGVEKRDAACRLSASFTLGGRGQKTRPEGATVVSEVG